MDRDEPRRLRSLPGFSVLDAVLTVGIVGILLAIAIPSLRPVVKANALDLDAERVVEAVYATADAARANAARRCLVLEGQALELSDGERGLREWALRDARFDGERRALCFDAEGDGEPGLVRLRQGEASREISVRRWGAACVVGRSCG